MAQRPPNLEPYRLEPYRPGPHHPEPDELVLYRPEPDDRHPRTGDGQTYVTAALAGVILGAVGYALWSSRRDPVELAARPPDDAPGRTASHQPSGRAVTGRTVTIDRPRQEIYAFWRDFQNLEGVMANVRAIEVEGNLTRWTIRGPGGISVPVETEIVDDRPGERIAWRSTPRSTIETEGRIVFRDAPGQRGTEVEAVISYVPPGGRVGQMIAKLFQAEPAIQGRRDLKRLKMLLETGEIATSDNRKPV